MSLKVRVESTYTRRLPQLEQLCALARERGLTDEATVTTTADGTVIVAEYQQEREADQ